MYVVNAPNMQSRDRAASTFVQVRVTTGGSAVEWGHRLGGQYGNVTVTGSA